MSIYFLLCIVWIRLAQFAPAEVSYHYGDIGGVCVNDDLFWNKYRRMTADLEINRNERKQNKRLSRIQQQSETRILTTINSQHHTWMYCENISQTIVAASTMTQTHIIIGTRLNFHFINSHFAFERYRLVCSAYHMQRWKTLSLTLELGGILLWLLLRWASHKSVHTKRTKLLLDI